MLVREETEDQRVPLENRVPVARIPSTLVKKVNQVYLVMMVSLAYVVTMENVDLWVGIIILYYLVYYVLYDWSRTMCN